uniref:GRF-type domain-containing protein n=1 Tax=Oryza glumipatula TaxID=40148 RepID=A0A0E0BPB7_9ORYZ
MDGSVSFKAIRRRTGELFLGNCPLCGTHLEERTSRTLKNPNKKFVKCPNLEHTPYACRFFMWEGQYEQFLADGRVGLGHQTEHEKFNVEAISSMGIEGLELKGFAALGQMLVYLAVVQALLLLVILVVVISK